MTNGEDNFYELDEEEDILDEMPDEDDDDDDEDDIDDIDIDGELDNYLGKFDEKKVIEPCDDDDDDDDDDDEEDTIDDDEEEKMVEETKKRVTFPILTKYEKNFILGFRTEQITNGSIILIDINKLKEKTPYNIAVEELNQGVIPFKIKRHLPNGTYEVWDITELIIT